jgi:hypothetical protein
MRDPAWVCDGCRERFPVHDSAPGIALEEARHHAENCPDGEEAVYDDGLDAADYDINFDGVGEGEA